MKILSNKEYENIKKTLRDWEQQYEALQRSKTIKEVEYYKLRNKYDKINNSFDSKLLKKLKEFIDTELSYHILPTNELIDLINLYRDILKDRSNI